MKRHITHFIPTCTFLFCLVLTSYAQPRLGIHFQYQPETEWAEEGYRHGFGGSIEFLSPNLRKYGPIQLMLGGELSIAQAGQERRDFDTPELIETGAQAISVHNMQYNLLGKTRLLAPAAWRVQPYVDFLGGLGVFNVWETLHFGTFDAHCEDSEGQSIATDWRFRAGAGLGMLVKINEGISIDLRSTYLRTGPVRYANLETVEMRDFQLNYNLDRTLVNPWTFQVGVNVSMDELDCSPSRGDMQ